MVQLDDGLDVSDNHPLVAEISSLRLAVSRFQDEAHSSSVKLQRQALESAKALERASQLERENDALKSEIAILRASPHPDASPQAHPAVLQVQQLTLSLRRLSDKLSLTEDALLTCTTELTHASGEAATAKHAAEGAYELAARTRGREEAGKVREIELEWKVKAAEEAVKMSDLVVNEYADLVRSLNTKAEKGAMITHSRSKSTTSAHDIEGDLTSNNGVATLPESLSQGKFGLQRLLGEFSGETEKLQIELLRLHAELETAEAKCEAERKVSEQSRVELANTLFELQKLKLEDNAAAKMVSRYMKFSQKSTDTLQDAMTALKKRHSATIATLSAQLYDVSAQLRSSEADVERLRNALDELGGDILKETYGRRREVALRIRMVNREEKIREGLERWLLRAEETLERDGDGPALHHEMVQSGRDILSSIDGPSPSSGSLGRLILAKNAVEELSKELEVETAKKLHLENLLGHTDRISPIFNEQNTTGWTMNEVANMVEPPIVSIIDEPAPESHGHEQLLPELPIDSCPLPSTEKALPPLHKDEMEETIPGEDSASEQPPIPDQPPQVTNTEKALPPLRKDETGKITPEEGLAPERPPIPDRPPQVTDTEFPPLQSESVQSEYQASPSKASLSLVDLSNPDLSLSSIPETQILPDEAITDTTKEPSVTETPDHDPIPSVTLEPSFPETEPPQEEVCEEPTTPPHFSLTAASYHQVSISFPSKQTPAGDQPPNTDIPHPLSHEHSLEPDLPPGERASPPAPTPSETVLPPPNITKRPPHPLLADLIKVNHRYDDLQRAFRDCHLALEALKVSMSSTAPANANSHLSKNGTTPPDVLRTALERLNDYTEDARVELEIRIADENLMARGFETLLSVPGALSSPSTTPRSLQESTEGLDSAPTQSEVERQIEDFISGADPAVEKALGNFTRKLDDIQHDIAALKHAIHDPVLSPAPPPTAPVANGGGWSSWITNTPSNPVSGSGSSPGPAPTFGNVMTTPRLRHSPSLNFQPQLRKGYLGGGSKDAFAALGLKVPMPSYVYVPETPQRSRTVSTMYMLGLGARRPSTNGSFVSPTQQSKKPPPRLHLEDDVETTDGELESEDDDADVE